MIASLLAACRRLVRRVRLEREEAARQSIGRVSRAGTIAAVRRATRERRRLEAPPPGRLELPAKGRDSYWREL